MGVLGLVVVVPLATLIDWGKELTGAADSERRKAHQTLSHMEEHLSTLVRMDVEGQIALGIIVGEQCRALLARARALKPRVSGKQWSLDEARRHVQALVLEYDVFLARLQQGAQEQQTRTAMALLEAQLNEARLEREAEAEASARRKEDAERAEYLRGVIDYEVGRARRTVDQVEESLEAQEQAVRRRGGDLTLAWHRVRGLLQEARQTLGSVSRSLGAGDLESANRQLPQLERSVEALAEALRSARR